MLLRIVNLLLFRNITYEKLLSVSFRYLLAVLTTSETQQDKLQVLTSVCWNKFSFRYSCQLGKTDIYIYIYIYIVNK